MEELGEKIYGSRERKEKVKHKMIIYYIDLGAIKGLYSVNKIKYFIET